MDMQQFSFQGPVFFAERDSDGWPKAFKRAGDTSTFDINLGVEKDAQRESDSGRRLLRSEIITAQNAGISLVLNDFTTANVGMALYSKPVVIAAGDVTDEPLPADLVAGDLVGLRQQNISDLEIEDDTETALTLGTHFRILSAPHGMIEILDLDGLTQPLIATGYDFAGGINLAMFTEPPPIRWVRLNAINTADGDRPVLAELYRVQFDPPDTMSLKHEGHGNLPLTGVALYDPTKEEDPILGRFGRIVDVSQPQSA